MIPDDAKVCFSVGTLDEFGDHFEYVQVVEAIDPTSVVIESPPADEVGERCVSGVSPSAMQRVVDAPWLFRLLVNFAGNQELIGPLEVVDLTYRNPPNP